MPDVEQTSAVIDLKVTPRPDDDVAITVKPESSTVLSGMGAKVIVCAVVPVADADDQLASGAKMPLTVSAMAQNTVRRLRSFRSAPARRYSRR